MSVVVSVSGCGLSPSYQYEALKSASNYDVCYAVTDPRQNMPMSGWTVKADVARKIARQRGITCDQHQFSKTHRRDTETRAIQKQQTDRAIQQLQNAIDGRSNSQFGGYSASQSTTCFKSSEWTSGFNKNCVYNCLGSEAVQTISATSLCPLSIQR